MAGIYIHIPFCASFCTYCGFYSEICNREEAYARYLEALRREMHLRRDFLGGERITTIYLGGGTPSLLPTFLLTAVADSLRTEFDLSAVEEFTVEVNPEDVVRREDLPQALSLCGANRISLGIQSFCDSHLRWMRRRHTASTAVEAFRLLREAGFDNISIDLIFGFAGLDDGQWRDNLSQAVALAPEHISAYQMSIDPESTLAEMAARGEYTEPDDETCARQYSILQGTLAAAGYVQYEISNFCLDGRHSRHNSAYWDRTAYLGLGPGAHSFNGNDSRQWNDPSLDDYCTALEGGFLPRGGGERLTDRDIFNERVMLGLRTARGVPKSLIDSAGKEYGAVHGLLQDTGNAYRIPRDKWFICDSIIEQYLK